MKVKDFFRILKFLRKTNTCLILKDDLELKMFGDYNEDMEKFHDVLMSVNIKYKQ